MIRVIHVVYRVSGIQMIYLSGHFSFYIFLFCLIDIRPKKYCMCFICLTHRMVIISIYTDFMIWYYL